VTRFSNGREITAVTSRYRSTPLTGAGEPIVEDDNPGLGVNSGTAIGTILLDTFQT